VDSRLRVTDHLLGYEWPVESGSAARGPTSWFAWTLRWRGLDSNLYGAFPVKWFFSVYHQFFVRSGKRVLRPVACDQVPGARGRG